MGFITEEPSPTPSRYNPFNPFADEIAFVRNSYLIAKICVFPFLVALWLLGWMFRIAFRMLEAWASKISKQGQNSTRPAIDKRKVGRSLVDPQE